MVELLIYSIIGFVAQIIDGSMGMAYGISCNTLLRNFLGLPSIVASACVHFVEIFTSLASAVSHIKLKNISKDLLTKLLVPGMIGGILGVYVLSDIYSEMWDPIIDIYLIIMGMIVFFKAFKKPKDPKEPKKSVYILGLIGGFSDAIGGGGWGPVVTSTLVASDHDIRKTVGSVNTAEFFVTLVQSIAFFTVVGNNLLGYTTILLGLLIGGVIAAPFAAVLSKKIPLKMMFIMVGILIVGINGYSLIMWGLK